MGVGLIICRVGCNDGSCKFCSQNLYRGECLGCLNGSYGPACLTDLLPLYAGRQAGKNLNLNYK